MAIKRTVLQRIKSAVSEYRKDYDIPAASAFFSQRPGGIFNNLFVYNGEKNFGELGPSKDLLLDYDSFRSRGKEFSLTNEVAQMIVASMEDWVIGNGLSLESEPNDLVLKSEGIEINVQDWSDFVEARMSLLKEMNETSYSKMRCFSQEESRAFTNSNNGGGVLCVFRIKDGIVNVEIIDGNHVQSPTGGSDWSPQLLDNGNRIIKGIELSPSNEHIAFHVLNHEGEYKRILAKSPSTGLTMACMYGGKEAGLDNHKTIPVLAGLFQTLQQMDDYKGHTLGSAKSQNAISYQIKTAVGGDAVNPIGDTIAKVQNYAPNSEPPKDSFGQPLADKVSVETGKQAFLLGEGQEISPLTKNEAELYFEAFWRTLFECVCAAAGMPPNVVLKRFDTSFSSARAAIKDWAHSLLLKRYKHGKGFNQKWYELQLHMDILTGKIQAPGYLTAFVQRNSVVLAAYRQARWVGDNVPEIDSKKEAEAIRVMLGPSMDHVPLTTVKRGTESLNQGSSKNNILDSGRDLKLAEEQGLKPVTVPVNNKDSKED